MKTNTTETAKTDSYSPSMPAILTEQDDFRTYEPEILRSDDEGGYEVWLGMQLCADYDRESGRWEHFYSTPVRANSRGQAEKQMALWLAKTAPRG